MVGSEVLTVERDGAVATVWLDAPDRRNAMGAAFWTDLPVVMAEVGDDPAVRAVVLAGRGRDFSVGLDLVEMGGLLAPQAGESPYTQRTRIHREIRRLQASISSVAECPVPVIAAIHGWCIGGGVDLATACDVRLAAADARFSVRETRLGIVADVGTLQRLPRIVGAGHVAELVYTGRDVDAAHAERIGLVNAVHPSVQDAQGAARAMAAEIAANPPGAVQGSKAVLAATVDMTVADGLEHVALWNASFLLSDDLTEAATAFLEKRPPRFTGT